MNGHQPSRIPKVSSFVAVLKEYTDTGNRERCLCNEIYERDQRPYFVRSADERIEIGFCMRIGETLPDNGGQSESTRRFILGEDSEWSESFGEKCMACGALIEFDTGNNSLRILTSIVGLPPLFLYRNERQTVITSDVYLLAKMRRVALHFDACAIDDLGQIGHPCAGRALFREVTTVPSGHALTLSRTGALNIAQHWKLSEAEPLTDWNAYIELQVSAFSKALQKIDLSRSFFSLTGGLDTRTVMAALVASKRSLPAYTLSGKTLTLDARIAKALCRAYGFQHTSVVLDTDFLQELPAYTTEASRLSGGLTSVGQAHEVYFYRKVGGKGGARLSGNLGNQVGRRGVERVSMRNADTSIFAHVLREQTDGRKQRCSDKKKHDGILDFSFLLRYIFPTASMSNYSIGNHFALQQSPYANRHLIEGAARMPRESKGDKPPSTMRLRLNDLRHRFIGELEHRSFQVQLIKQVGGFVASHPINWGWRANGGVSAKGLILGVSALIDAVASIGGLYAGIPGKAFDTLGILGLHEYRNEKLWVDVHLKEFVHDILMSGPVRNSGLFNETTLRRILKEHYSGRLPHYKEVVFALDLALATLLFNAAV